MATATRPGEALWSTDPYEEVPELPKFKLQPREVPSLHCPECWELGTGYGTYHVKMMVTERQVTNHEIRIWLECPVCGFQETYTTPKTNWRFTNTHWRIAENTHGHAESSRVERIVSIWGVSIWWAEGYLAYSSGTQNPYTTDPEWSEWNDGLWFGYEEERYA